MATTGKVSHELNQVLRELSKARDDARVRAHLFSQEAKQRLGDLETEIENFERKLSDRGEWVAEQVVSTARALTHAVGELLTRSDGTSDVRARDVMTRDVRVCHPQDALNRAAQLMWDANCGSVPVVDEAGKLVGIITDRDVCMAAYTRGQALAELRVESSMSTVVHSCRAEDPLRRVMELMTQHQVRRVPVVGDEGTLLGIVALADIARLAQAPSAQSQQARVWMSGLLAGISEPAPQRAENGAPSPQQSAQAVA